MKKVVGIRGKRRTGTKGSAGRPAGKAGSGSFSGPARPRIARPSGGSFASVTAKARPAGQRGQGGGMIGKTPIGSRGGSISTPTGNPLTNGNPLTIGGSGGGNLKPGGIRSGGVPRPPSTPPPASGFRPGSGAGSTRVGVPSGEIPRLRTSVGTASAPTRSVPMRAGSGASGSPNTSRYTKKKGSQVGY